jgi:tRNA (cytidine/uridine-2'-O-)-methyltransferase
VHTAADSRLVIPLKGGMRSLNVAVTAAMAVGEALRQVGGFPQIDFLANGEGTNDERT